MSERENIDPHSYGFPQVLQAVTLVRLHRVFIVVPLIRNDLRGFMLWTSTNRMMYLVS